MYLTASLMIPFDRGRYNWSRCYCFARKYRVVVEILTVEMTWVSHVSRLTPGAMCDDPGTPLDDVAANTHVGRA